MEYVLKEMPDFIYNNKRKINIFTTHLWHEILSVLS